MRIVQIAVLFSAGITSAAGQSTGLALAGSGYNLAYPILKAAPGEMIVVSVYGIQTPVPVPLTAHGATQLGGITVSLLQSGAASGIPVNIYGVQQAPCPGHPSGCLAVTALTLQIPFELGQISSAGMLPALTIQENGVTAGQVPILPVSDALHILNSCDNTLIFYSLAVEVPPGSCAPMILHAHGPLVSASSPAVPGETLIMNLYGMGVVSPPPALNSCCQSLPVQPFTLNFDFRPNAAGIRLDPAGAGGTPVTDEVYAYAGLYQVNFVVPSIPVGATTPACGPGVRSNLTVSVNGPASMDAAQLCVQTAGVGQ